jgi:hypothetical protein
VLGKMPWLAAPVLALLLGGCSQRAPSASDVVGTWTCKGCGHVTFLADGRFEARDVPAENLLGIIADPHGPPRIDAAGTWKLTAPPGKWEFGTMAWEIDLHLGPVPGHVKIGAGVQPSYEIGNVIRLDGDDDKTTFYEKLPPGAHFRME